MLINTHKLPDSPLLFVRSLGQVKKLLRVNKKILTRISLISCDLDVSALLRQWGFYFNEVWEFVPQQKFDQAISQAQELSQEWFQPFETELKIKGISLPEVDQEALSFFFKDALAANIIFDSIFRKRGFKTLCIMGKLFRPAEWYYENDAIEAIWVYKATRQGYRVINLDRSLMSLLDKDHLRSIAKNIKLTAKKNLIRLRRAIPGHALKSFLSLPQATHDKNRILLAFLGGDWARMVSLLNLLCQENDYQVLALSLQGRVQKHIQSKASEMGVKIHSVEDLYNVDQLTNYTQSAKYAWKIFNSKMISYHESYPEIFLNPYLAFHFRHFFLSRWPKLAHLAENLDYAISQWKPACLIGSSLPDGEQWLAYKIADKHNVTTLSVPHSGVGFSIKPESNYASLWSNSQRQSLIQLGFDPERLFVTGDIGNRISFTQNNSEVTANKIRSQLNIPQNKKIILVITSISKLGLLARFDHYNHALAFECLIKGSAEVKEGVHVIIKCHPHFDNMEFYEDLVNRFNAHNHVTVVRNCPLDILAELADVGIIINNSTTGYLSILLKQKPLLFLNASNIDTSKIPYLEAGGALIIKDKYNIWPTFDRLFNDNNYRNELVSKQQSFLNTDLPYNASQAKKRFRTLLEQLC